MSLINVQVELLRAKFDINSVPAPIGIGGLSEMMKLGKDNATKAADHLDIATKSLVDTKAAIYKLSDEMYDVLSLSNDTDIRMQMIALVNSLRNLI